MTKYRIVSVKTLCEQIFFNVENWCYQFGLESGASSFTRTQVFDREVKDDRLLYQRLCDEDRADQFHKESLRKTPHQSSLKNPYVRQTIKFRLAELLLFVAIIGVLVAISIPIFTAQLEKSREAVDLANIRAAYAECSTAVLTGETENGVTAVTGGNGYQKNVEIVQQKAGWTSSNANVEVAGKVVSDLGWTPKDSAEKYTVIVTVGNDGVLSVKAES